MIDLSGYNILLTGAGGTIGSGIARLLHKLGANLYISGSNERRLLSLGKALGDRYDIRLCDLNDEDACANLVLGIENLDVTICNAGITLDNLMIRMKNEDFRRVINVNLYANFILMRESIKKMLTKRFGRVISITSVVGISGNPGQSNYCASKAGLIGMSKSLAYEVAGRGITVNSVAPGFVSSTMTDSLSEEQKSDILKKIPQKKFGTSDDIAGIVAFLASTFSSYITGQTFHINGGMLMV